MKTLNSIIVQYVAIYGNPSRHRHGTHAHGTSIYMRRRGLQYTRAHDVQRLDFCYRVACAHKTTAKAIFKPVSLAWQPRAGLQWRKADQPTEMA